jgi:2-oxoglutarate ferredoxin oxidoreductase subunit alpha
MGAAKSVSVALTGSGGSGVITAGNMLLDAAGKAGWYGLMTRSSGPQIRGGEAAALIRLSPEPVATPDDAFDILTALDWENVHRFADELPLTSKSLILADPAAGEMPAAIAAKGARMIAVPFKELAKKIPEGRPNMVGLGAAAALAGLTDEAVQSAVDEALGKYKPAARAASAAAVAAGRAAANGLTLDRTPPHSSDVRRVRWTISGNEAAGLGALRGGVRFVAAYPITPATEILEWMTPALREIGGVLVQAEDELASINMIMGASYGGTPALTATSGPGLALMLESLGLAVASETPLVLIDVMRGGPSTGIPTKSEQTDLNVALYGLHGEAPHLVLAPNSVADCLFTTQWAVHLAEALQTPAIVLSDQFLGQARAIIDRPSRAPFAAAREVVRNPTAEYRRYAVSESGVSPMTLPGTRGGQYTADGLEHNPRGTPSSQASDHRAQMDKRARKLERFDYGPTWADIEGEGDVAVLTWGSTTGAVREALQRAAVEGLRAKLISLRLLWPAQPARLAAALAGARRVLVVEQSHSGQFYRYLRAHHDVTAEMRPYFRPGPLPFRPAEILAELRRWS